MIGKQNDSRKILHVIPANSEETAAASQAISAQSESLLDVVGRLNQIAKGNSIVDGSHEKKEVAQVTARKQTSLTKEPQRQLRGQQAKTVNPDEVIPIDDSDFKEF